MKAQSLVVFPGQGSQFPGMGKSWFENFSLYRDVIEEASDACSLDFKKLSFEASESEIRDTEIAQPLILTVSCGMWKVLNSVFGFKEKVDAKIYAGHSLGEYTALVCSDVLSLKEASSTVMLRGRFMKEACPVGLGGMRALIMREAVGREKLLELCEVVSKHSKLIALANWNTDTQVVLSGYSEGLQYLDTLVGKDEWKWVRRSIPLEVSGPFHSPLMEKATEKLGLVLESLNFSASSAQYIPNVRGELCSLENSQEIQSNLKAQVAGGVQWYPGLLSIKDQVTHHIEVAPSKVLTGMVARVDSLKHWKNVHFEDPTKVEEVFSKI